MKNTVMALLSGYVAITLIDKADHAKVPSGFYVIFLFFVIIPAFCYIKMKEDVARSMVIGVMLIFSLVVTVKDSRVGGGDCHTEWDGRNNPTVCE